MYGSPLYKSLRPLRKSDVVITKIPPEIDFSGLGSITHDLTSGKVEQLFYKVLVYLFRQLDRVVKK